jgi:radical SAM superfamily enzyme YgiQ (UPF0313 family)
MLRRTVGKQQDLTPKVVVNKPLYAHASRILHQETNHGCARAIMYRLNCKNPKAEQTCRRPSCVYPTICEHIDTDQSPTVKLYREVRNLPGI